MKRFLATAVLVLLAAAGLAACSSGDDAVVTVNGDVVLNQDDWDTEIEELGANNDALDAFDARGTGTAGTVDAGYASTMLSNHVFGQLVEDLLDQEGVVVSDQDVTTGTDILTSVLANPDQESGNTPIELDDMPARYKAVLIDIYSGFTALIRHYGATPEDQTDPAIEDAQARFGAALDVLRADADVEIASRYGTWNGEPPSPGVDPPEGPVTPTTVPVAVPAGG